MANFFCCTCRLYKPRTTKFFCKNKRTSDGFSHQCKECAKLYRQFNKIKRKKYKSSSKEYRQKYLMDNKEHINNLRRKKYEQLDKDILNSIRRQKYKQNKEIVKQKNSEYYLKNKTKINLKDKNYRQNNKHSIYLRNRLRKLKIKHGDKITQQELHDLLKNHHYKCFYCKIKVDVGINLHFDHKIPLSKNGPHSLENLVPACKTCNLQKGIKTAEEFLSQIRMK